MRLRKQRDPRVRAFSAFGVAVQVELPDPALWDAVEQVLPPGRVPCHSTLSTGRFVLDASGQDDDYGLMIGAQPWIEHASLEVAVGALDQQLRLFIAANAPDYVFVHAGVVAVDRRALLVPGQSFSGKTTLVRALVESGAMYLSDEYAVLDGAGRVHPYARPLSLRGEDGVPLGERPVAELGGTAEQDSAEVALVVLTRYRAGCEWRPQARTRAEGVVALMANTVPAQERPHDSLRTIAQAIRGATVLEGDRGDASALAPALLEQLSARPRVA